VTTAIVLATAPSETDSEGHGEPGPAAALPWDDGTVLQRLLSQLADLGVPSAHVITRPGWEEVLRPSLEAVSLAAELHTSPGTAEDLHAIAQLTETDEGGVLVTAGDVVTHREALAGLLADPRVTTGVLGSSRRLGRAFAFRARAVRGRVVSSASPYHAVHRPNLRYLGILKVAPASRGALAEAAGRLAVLTEPPVPPAWEAELRAKEGAWRQLLARLARDPEEEPFPDDDPVTEEVALSDDDETELDRWIATAPQDASSLLLVGLVRSGTHVGVSHLRDLFWARPLSRDAAVRAADEITSYDEDRVLLDSAVKANDGFFTTYFVSPYSKYVARWAARRGFTPNQVTTVSLGIGILSAAAFATGERAGLIAGAILLQIAFMTDCVDGQLARYTRTFSSLGAWLDSIFDRTKEYVVFAGLAIGASRTGDSVWLLAGAALALQTARHAVDFSYPIVQHQVLAGARQPPLEQPADRLTAAVLDSDAPAPAPTAAQRERGLGARILGRGFAIWRTLHRRPGVRWVKKIIAFPIGERFAVISLTAAVWDAHTTFVVLLAWGGASAAYKMAGRMLRSVVR
jgi:CDP-alcohol phosphatidyltransferase-like enzyme